MGKKRNQVPERRLSPALLPAGDGKEPVLTSAGVAPSRRARKKIPRRCFFMLEKLVGREKNKKHYFPLVF